MTLRVAIAGEHSIIRFGLRGMLQAYDDLKIVNEAGHSEAANEIPSFTPDVVFIDLDSRKFDGVLLACSIRTFLRDTLFGFLVGKSNSFDLVKILCSTPGACLQRNVEPDALSSAISALRARKTYVSPELSAQFLSDIQLSKQIEQNIETLTARQREILRMIAEGMGSKEISNRLGIEPRTVERHRQHIMDHLNVHDISGLVHFALKVGLVKPRT